MELKKELLLISLNVSFRLPLLPMVGAGLRVLVSLGLSVLLRNVVGVLVEGRERFLVAPSQAGPVGPISGASIACCQILLA